MATVKHNRHITLRYVTMAAIYSSRYRHTVLLRLISGLTLSADPSGLLGLWVRIPPGARMSVCQCYVLPGGGLSNGPIPRPEEPYRVLCVSASATMCDNNLYTYS